MPARIVSAHSIPQGPARRGRSALRAADVPPAAPLAGDFPTRSGSLSTKLAGRGCRLELPYRAAYIRASCAAHGIANGRAHCPRAARRKISAEQSPTWAAHPTTSLWGKALAGWLAGWAAPARPCPLQQCGSQSTPPGQWQQSLMLDNLTPNAYLRPFDDLFPCAPSISACWHQRDQCACVRALSSHLVHKYVSISACYTVCCPPLPDNPYPLACCPPSFPNGRPRRH